MNNDQQVTPADALAIINDLNRMGVRSLLASTPRAAAGGMTRAAAVQSSVVSTTFLDVNGDSNVTPADALMVVNALDADDKVQIRLETTDVNNNPVSSVAPGDTFKLRAFVRDVRPPVQGEERGVFAAYVDVTYQQQFALIDSGAEVVFGPKYQNVQNADVDTAGLVDDTGAVVTPIETPSGSAEFLLWEVTVDAVAVGNVTFTADPPDTQSREILVFGENAAVPPSQVDFGTATVLVTNAPLIAAEGVATAEGNSDMHDVEITVSLTAAATQPVTVQYTTADGTATLADNDYVTKSGTITFPTGETEQVITVQVRGDTKIEPTETFVINLSAPTGGQEIGNPSPAVTITNDDFPTVSINDVSVVEDVAGVNPTATFTITLSEAFVDPVTVVAATADGTAISTGPLASRDFNAVAPQTIVFAPGQTTKTFNVTVRGDANPEPNENFLVNLSGLINASSTNNDLQGQGTILSDDDTSGGPQIAIGDVTVTEGDGATPVTAAFTVTITGTVTAPFTFVYNTVDGTATAPADYVAQPPTTVTVNPGDTTKTINVLVNGDAIDEPTETFIVRLSGVTGGVSISGDPDGTGTITDNDPLPSLTIADASIVEGDTGTTNLVFTAVLTGDSSQTVQFTFATADGTARAGRDYTATPGTLTFAPGDPKTKTISVPVTPDLFQEANETLLLNLSGASGLTLARTQITGTITDDDPDGPLESSDVSGKVFLDSNGNGVQDAGERPVQDSIIQIRQTDGVTVLFETRTDASGVFLFEDVPAGNFVLAQIQPNEFITGNANTQPLTVTGGSAVTTAPSFTEQFFNPDLLSKRQLLASSQNGSASQPFVVSNVQATDAAMAQPTDWLRRR